MTQSVKEPESTEKTTALQTTSSSTNPPSSSRRINLVLAIMAFLASLALLALAIVWYFSSTNQPTTPTQATITPSSPVLNPTAGQAGFGIQADPATPSTTTSAGDEPTRLRTLADDYLLQGRPIDAAAEYQLILTNYASSSQAQPALYGFGRASVAREQWSAAADAFKKYVAAYPKDGLQANCYYYLGLVDKQLGYWDEAISYFQKYQAENGGNMPLAGYADNEIADAYNNTLRPDQANDAYKKLVASSTSITLKATTMEKIGDYYAQHNNPTEALNWYNQVLTLAKIPDYRASIVVKEAHAYDTAGQADQAVAATRLLVNQYIGTPSGFATLKTLFNNNSPLLDDYYRGYYSLQTDDYTGAITTFDRFLGRADGNVAQPATPAGMSADDQNRLARGWYYLANTYEANNDLTRATTEYQALLTRFPQGATATDCLTKLANLALKQNAPDQAMTFYAQMAQSFPGTSQAASALYSEVELAMDKGPEAAQPYVDNLVQKFPGASTMGEAYYDLGRAYQTKGNTAAARTAFQQAAAAPQVDFFTIRANERLADAYDPNKPPRSNPATQPAVYSPQVFAADLTKDRATMESWLPSWATTIYTGTTTLDVARANISKDAGVQRMIALIAIGDSLDAHQEAKEAVDRFTAQPLELYWLSLTLSEQGDYYYSMAAAEQLLARYQQKNPTAGIRQVPLLLQKLVYPLPYQSIILEQSRTQDFDPLLLAATIRRESSFFANARSGAGAIGLAQIIPDTGKGIATSLDKSDFQTSDLYQPYTAIEFGSYYLETQLKSFDGNVYQALAAYNGGAGNVSRWNKANPPEQNFDGWVFGIDYPETRAYVELVYANYYLYRQIYTTP